MMCCLSNNSWSSSNSIAMSGNSWGSSIGGSNSWSGMSTHNSLGGVGLNCGMVHVWGLNNLLDWVNLVWGWDWDSSWDSDLVWLGNMLGNLDLTGNSSWHSNWDINVVLVDLDLWDDVGHLGGDSGVRSDWGLDHLLCDSVSWGRSSWNWSWWDGGIGCWGSWDSWGGQGSGLNKVLWSASSIGDSWLGDMLLSGNNILVSRNSTGVSGLDSSLSNNTVFHSVLNNSWSSSIAVVSLSYSNWGMCHWSTDHLAMASISRTNNVGGSSRHTGHEGP